MWETHDHVLVTEDTALGRSIAATERVHFVPHFAVGQARLGAPVKMLRTAIASALRSLAIVRQERPDLIITTGAGSQVFILLWGRLWGARIILIDSFARFRRPSLFARLAGPLAHVRIAQSAESAARWKGARVFDPFRLLEVPRPAKEPLLFATVGATLPFDRLVTTVANAKQAGLVPERVIAQRGVGGVAPAGIETVEELPFDEVTQLLDRADIVVCHGGTGSLITALRASCRVVALPRRFSRGEHYDDHQAEIVEAFAERGLIDWADTEADFAAALARARARTPRAATTDPSALLAFLAEYAAQLQGR